MRLREKVRCCKGRNSLLKECLNVGVVPKDVVKRIANSRARHTLAMEKAFILDDLIKEEVRFRHLLREVNLGMSKAKQFLLKFHYITLCSYIGEINVKKTFENKQR